MWLNLAIIGSEQEIANDSYYYEALTNDEYVELFNSGKEHTRMGRVHIPLLDYFRDEIEQMHSYLQET